jgi:hypothetical protein
MNRDGTVAKSVSFSGALFGVCLLPFLPEPLIAATAADQVLQLNEHLAGNPDDLSAQRDLGLAFVQLSIEGSTSAAADALEQFEIVLAADPDDVLARVNRGLAIVLQARDAPLLKKRNMADWGFAEIDRAVESAPGDAAVRLVRAINAYQMPQILGRGAIAREDFSWLVAVATSQSGRLDPALRRSIFFHAGSFALKDDDPAATELLEWALENEGESPTTGQIQTMLALARGKFRPHADAQSKVEAEAAPSGF